MKKFLALLLAMLLILSLAACGETASSTAAETADSEESQPEEKPAEDAPEAPAEEPFEEVTLVENDACVVKVTGIDPDNAWGYTLKIYLENKSADKTYMFSVANAAVNGVQTDPYFAAEVAAGKKANEEINFMDSSLEENGITEFTDIELSFRVYDSDDWEADAVAAETVHVYPLGEDKAAAFVREPQPEDLILADNDAVTVIVTGYEDDEIWGPAVNLFLVNKTDADVMFSVDDVSVNGFMADPFYATTVTAGKCAFSSMSWVLSDLEDIDVTKVSDIEEIELAFRAYNSDDWSAAYFQETVTLTPGA